MSKQQTAIRNWLEQQHKNTLINFILEIAQTHERVSGDVLFDRARLHKPVNYLL